MSEAFLPTSINIHIVGSLIDNEGGSPNFIGHCVALLISSHEANAGPTIVATPNGLGFRSGL